MRIFSCLFEPVKEKCYCFSFDAIGIPNDYAKARTGKSDGIYFYLILFIKRRVSIFHRHRYPFWHNQLLRKFIKIYPVIFDQIHATPYFFSP
jgi:hypothetical protein